MRDIPVIFSAAMVIALLAGRKTMTRRLRWVGPKAADGHVMRESAWARVHVGDRLWVKENFWRWGNWNGSKKGGKITYTFQPRREPSDLPDLIHAADWTDAPAVGAPDRGKFAQAEPAWHLRPNIFLERQHSRLTLVVVETKIERLHKISRDDVLAEGIPPEEIKRWEQWFHPDDCPGHAFGVLWDSINGKGEWDKNPEVVALRFTAHMTNIDSMSEAAA